MDEVHARFVGPNVCQLLKGAQFHSSSISSVSSLQQDAKIMYEVPGSVDLYYNKIEIISVCDKSQTLYLTGLKTVSHVCNVFQKENTEVADILFQRQIKATSQGILF